ncbi:restriction endonuclease subunit S [Haemophilus influenzae]|uniref:Putative type I site-specific restriction-modification system, S subunit n=1 Tax=Haemophilus influenzae 22.4-21 TaxID=375063 RepID=A4P096_HAEIF|nr:restriction endonuclease subunit S [Haemophilus influenzae]EDK13166.1 putative type I site-specific restriction-modification system, S subunit [Haemophilus influenzae 22.4-21]MCK9089317.1 restriction endonuclease subunit S [Haemophilus influenzae]
MEWLRQIPSHWDMQRSKFIFKKVERKVNEEDQIVTCFRDGQVTLRANRRTEGFTNALKEHGYQGIRKGDLVIHAMDAFTGAIGISDSDGKATPVYSVCLPHNKQKIDVYFYAYYLRNLALSGFISSLAKGIRERSTDFRYADFAELLLPIPPYLEQQQIAQFLDDKTAKIDRAVDLAEKQIALLKEHKQILIQNAVTRGLNPDVPLKDSGVEWIGQVPEHWELTIGMNVFRENKRDNKGMKENTVLSLSYGKIIIKPEEKLFGLVPESFETYQIVEPNDIIIRCTDLQNDQTSLRTGLAQDKGIITSAYLNLKVINNYSAKFLHYYLHALDITKVLYKFGSGLRQNLSFLDFKRLPIIDISLAEQQQIADYLDKQTSKIDQVIALKTAHIEKLKEYKSVLINDVVTGKVRV